MRMLSVMCLLVAICALDVASAGKQDPPGADADLSRWYPWTATSTPEPGVIGMQDWLEKPAGRHGRIERRGDKLIYNGRPIKLWGLNLCYRGGCAPQKAVADARAAFYAKYGINAVRLHKYADGAGWAGIMSRESFTEFDPEGLDNMDYQIARLKEKGIYVLLSAHFGSIPLGPRDRETVPYMDELTANEKDGAFVMQHSAVYYSPELQQVQIQHYLNLLEHKNPYTGMTYAEDPAVAFIEILNEQSILFYTSMNPLKASPTLREDVGRRFCQWLTRKYGSEEALLAAWGADSLDHFAGDVPDAEPEDLEAGTILPLGHPWHWDPERLDNSEIKRRHLDTIKFLHTLQRDFYARFVQAVREAGYEGEVLGSNWQAGRAYSHFANLHTDYLVGTIDRHNYYRWSSGAMLDRPGSGLLSAGMQQVIDRPFMLSEWLHTFPNDWYAESVAIIGAYAMGLQGWDVSYIFQNRDPGAFKEALGGFDVAVPNVLGLFPAVSRQVLRDDVAQSDVVAARNVHVPSLFEGKLSFDDRVVQGYNEKELDSSKVPARALAVARHAVRFTDEYRDTPVFDMAPYEEDGTLVSSTGQLRWTEGAETQDGYFTIDTAGTKAVVGFASGQAHTVGEVTIRPHTRFAAVYVTALDRDATVRTGDRLLVTAIGRARNTGMELQMVDGQIRPKERGGAPILLQPVRVEVKIARPGRAEVTVLDQDGRVTPKELPVAADGSFTVDTGRDRTPYYLVTLNND